MAKIYREGPIGAMMDEYERASEELINLLRTIDSKSYVLILDAKTEDEDCRSIQTIMNHVVRAGYGYANYIRIQFGDDYTERKEHYPVDTPDEACVQLNNMLSYTADTLQNKMDITFDDILKNIIKSRSGQHYDIDQLLEHAIVHILRHRRQIEKLLSNIN